ncbi:MAG: hypothetical protein PHI28_03030 [Mangrovibacterium sp.]|nr:hypothetical protein [Mangrovibacterium sp.]
MKTHKKEIKDDLDSAYENFVSLLKTLSDPELNDEADKVRAEMELARLNSKKDIWKMNFRATKLNAIADERNRRNMEKLRDFLSRQGHINFGLTVIHRREKSALSDQLMAGPTHLRLIS